jgi:aspartyl protease family protein
MKNSSNDDNNFTRRAGTFMTVAGWIVFGILLVAFFNNMLEKQNNPNTDLATVYRGEQREVVLQRNKFGHYVASGQINGKDVVFLVDTGATDVAIPERTADRLGLKKGRAYRARTANGLATAYATRLDSIALGDIVLYDVDASILANAGTQEILLGMSFLKQMELIQKGRQLTIRQ